MKTCFNITILYPVGSANRVQYNTIQYNNNLRIKQGISSKNGEASITGKIKTCFSITILYPVGSANRVQYNTIQQQFANNAGH